MPEPVASVLLPYRNAAATLGSAAGTILAQTMADLELVAVDDGSSDGSAEIVAALAAGDARVRAVAASGRGIVAALQTGLGLCRARWIARMDADDLAHPRRLELQLARAAQQDAPAVVGCAVEIFPESAVTDGMAHYIRWLNSLTEPSAIAREMLIESPIAHPTALIRRDALEACGGYRDGPFPEDYDLWLRLHLAGYPFAKVPDVLLSWRDSPGRLSRRDPRYSREAFQRLKAAALKGGFLAGHERVQIWGAGPDGKSWRRALAEHGIDVARYFDIDPRKIGGRVGGQAPVLPLEALWGHRELKLLGAVGVKGARELMRQALVERGFVEGSDYLFVQ